MTHPPRYCTTKKTLFSPHRIVIKIEPTLPHTLNLSNLYLLPVQVTLSVDGLPTYEAALAFQGHNTPVSSAYLPAGAMPRPGGRRSRVSAGPSTSSGDPSTSRSTPAVAATHGATRSFPNPPEGTRRSRAPRQRRAEGGSRSVHPEGTTLTQACEIPREPHAADGAGAREPSVIAVPENLPVTGPQSIETNITLDSIL